MYIVTINPDQRHSRQTGVGVTYWPWIVKMSQHRHTSLYMYRREKSPATLFNIYLMVSSQFAF